MTNRVARFFDIERLEPVERPEPLATFHSYVQTTTGWATAITRVWPSGTGYCGLLTFTDPEEDHP